MATISKIRGNFYLITVLLALALLGFLFMDFMGQRGRGNMGPSTVATVDGVDIDQRQIQYAEDLLYKGSSASPYQIKAALYDQMARNAIIQKKSESLGFAVSNDELYDACYGENISDLLKTRFTNANGQFDRTQLDQINQANQNGTLPEDYKPVWKYQQDEVRAERMQDKYTTMISKAVYEPTFLAEDQVVAQNATVDFEIVQVPFTTIADDAVAVTDSDIKNYMADRKQMYEVKKEQRRLAYVTFDVVPTQADSMAILEEAQSLVTGLKNTDNDSLFLTQNQGVYNIVYNTKDELSPALADVIFDIPVGDVYGPYLDGSNYIVDKVIDIKTIPDSVRARHILFKGDTPESAQLAMSNMDSVRTLIQDGKKSFAEMASEFGTDATATKGGDLGYFGPNAMVKPFNDLAFYQAKEGKLYTVVTQFGLHLVEVTGKKFITNKKGVRLGQIEKFIAPSEETQTSRYEVASTFARDNRTLDAIRTAIENDPSLKLTVTNPIGENDYFIGGLGQDESTRQMVRFAFKHRVKEGEVSPDVFEFRSPQGWFNDKIVVAGLDNVQKPGMPSVESMRDELKGVVLAQMKGEKIAADIGNKTMSEVSTQYAAETKSINAQSLANTTIQGLGREPRVIGAMEALSNGASAGPIVGAGGVYMVKVINKVENPANNLAQIKAQKSVSDGSRIKGQVMTTIMDDADIQDNRAMFY